MKRIGLRNCGRPGIHLFGVDEPAAMFLLGSDDYGRDQFSRFLFGAQISLLAGPLAACLALALGAAVGGMSGFYGGFADDLLMAVTELVLSLPWLYLLLAVRALAASGSGAAPCFSRDRKRARSNRMGAAGPTGPRSGSIG